MRSNGHTKAYTFEAGQRRVEIAVELTGITAAGGVTAPGMKERGDDEELGVGDDTTRQKS